MGLGFLLWIIGPGSSAPGEDDSAGVLPEGFLSRLPAGWAHSGVVEVPAEQVAAIAGKLGGDVTRVTNTGVSSGGVRFQLNTVHCATAADADRVEASLVRMQGDARLVARHGTVVVELVTPGGAESLRLALDARNRLGIAPARVTYRVSFDVAPVLSGDAMAWNPLYNEFLRLERGEDRVAAIAELAERFTFGGGITLRVHGQGSDRSEWSFEPVSRATRKLPGARVGYGFTDLLLRAGVPVVSVSGTVTSCFGDRTPAGKGDPKDLLVASPTWPVDDPEIRALARTITEGMESRAEKVAALLAWLVPGRNIRFGGPSRGSRHGVAQALSGREGRCWDFSDLFVTLARASGVPARQVLGWLHGVEGHVWVEVLEGEDESGSAGFRAFDPTTGLECGSDHVPWFTSHDGALPPVDAGTVSVEPVPPTRED